MSGASGSMAGYIFQLDRAIFHLATDTDCQRVGIETLDDLTVESDGTLKREQLKHSISKIGNPFGVRSKNLWRSLEIWADSIADNPDRMIQSRFILVTSQSTPPGTLVQQISDAHAAADIDYCLAALMAAVPELDPKVKAIAKRLLAHSTRSLRALINNIELQSNSPVASELRGKIIAGLHIPSDIPADYIVDSLFGWAKEVSMDAWRARKPAIISKVAFDTHADRLRQSVRQSAFRERAKSLFTIDQTDVAKHRDTVFVRQIELIAETNWDEIVTIAINDFLRASSERTRLSTEGNVTKDDLAAFDENLRDRWNRIFQRVTSATPGASDFLFQGRAIFHETTDHCGVLAGIQTSEIYLTAGSYHRLANSTDSKSIGWHPKHKELLNDAD